MPWRSISDHISKVLPDDVVKALTRLRTEEKSEAASSVYDTMFRNMEMAEDQSKPLCQDTGIVQFKVICGSEHPAIAEIGESLKEAVIKAQKRLRSDRIASRLSMRQIQVTTQERAHPLYGGK